MARHSCCPKKKLRKGLWSPEEDEKLFNYITRFGVGCWSSVPKLAGLERCGKSCRLRWINYLRPDLKRGMFSQEEEDLIIELHKALGNRWAQIATHLPGRTDNEIKNFWNSSIKKKLMKQGIDPKTHRTLSENSTDKASSLQPLPPIFNPGLDSTLEYDQAHYQLLIPESGDGFGFCLPTLVNESKESSSSSSNMNSTAPLGWDACENYKSESLFQYGQYQVEDQKPNPWQVQQLHDHSLDDLSYIFQQI